MKGDQRAAWRSVATRLALHFHLIYPWTADIEGKQETLNQPSHLSQKNKLPATPLRHVKEGQGLSKTLL